MNKSQICTLMCVLCLTALCVIIAGCEGQESKAPSYPKAKETAPEQLQARPINSRGEESKASSYPKEKETAPEQLQARPINSRGESGIASTSTQWYNEASVLSREDVLQKEAVTVCMLKSLTTPPSKDKSYRNNLVGQLSIGRNLMTQMSNQALTYVGDVSYDNAIPVRIDNHIYLLVMERKGDRIKLDDAKSSSPPLIGVGSEIRFDTTEWVPFFGANYRGGGFKVTKQDIVYLQGTQRQSPQGTAVFNGMDWTMTESTEQPHG